MGKVKECEKRLSLNLIAGVCAGVGVVLLMVAAVVGVIYFCCRSSNKGKYHQQIL
ncbi:Leucine-rich repeat and transmembrane domain-containing protein 2 [Labeo rohita]|uniref:Leucine-rich repeat and transmembrane domain-containing protein 2 n=1 Tax=Labeo rohita TaxID=84645 RepID=A0ABQ8KZ36_LABRO|nr:Leucine-rich repeat and transmembrane domain-containing protein 2 [Labeo rohita]